MHAIVKPAEDPVVDPQTVRDVVGCFATGIAVMTTMGRNGLPVGLVVNSFSSLSLDPPLVMWGISRDAPSFVAFRSHTGFAVNIVAAQTQEEALRFARPSANGFAGRGWSKGLRSLPVLDRALAMLECRTLQQLPGGDHVIIIGQVERCRMGEGDPLLLYRGRFATIGPVL